MDQDTGPQVHESIAEMLASRGRPLPDDGLDRARQRLAEADARRDPAAREALKQRLTEPLTAA